MTVNTYRIYIRSNANPRTINTPMMGRTNYSIITVEGAAAMYAKVADRQNGHKKSRYLHCSCICR